jgi:hypothetical protein
MQAYAVHFLAVKESKQAALSKILHQVGLALANGNLSITSAERWQQVSMLERVPSRMPPTTNSLESIHGHLNTQTPRRNAFWRSLQRIVVMMIFKSGDFACLVRYNFADEVREAYTRGTKTDRNVMQRESDWYGTTANSCKYGETSRLWTIYGFPFPCSHQYSLEVDKPSIPPTFEIDLRPTWQNCVLDIVEVNRNPPGDSRLHLIHLKEVAVRNIKKFSYSRRKEKIRQFVEGNLVIGTELHSDCPFQYLISFQMESNISVNKRSDALDQDAN